MFDALDLRQVDRIQAPIQKEMITIHTIIWNCQN